MSAIFWRTSFGMSMYVLVVISPATITSPVVTSVSQATRPFSSSARTASRIVSESWSATLSGWPSVTDSEVKRNSRAVMRPGRLLNAQEAGEDEPLPTLRRVEQQAAQRREVVLRDRRDRRAAALRVREGVVEPAAHVRVQEPVRLARHSRSRDRGRVGRIAGELRPWALHRLDRRAAVRDHELAVERGGVDRRPAHVELARLHGADLHRPRVHATAELGERGRLLDHASGLGLVAHADGEQQRRGSGRRAVEGKRALAAQELEDVVEARAERGLDLSALLVEARVGAGVVVEQRVEPSTHVVEREVERRAGRKGARKVGVVSGAAQLQVPAQRGIDPDPARLRRHRRAERVELSDLVGGRAGGPALLLDRLVDRGLDRASSHEGLRDRVARETVERVVEDRVAVEPAAVVAKRLELVELCLAVREHRPAVDLFVHGWARALLEHGVELVDVLGLRDPDEVVAAVLEVEPDEIDLVAERRLHVLLPAQPVLLERGAEAREHVVLAREPVQ